MASKRPATSDEDTSTGKKARTSVNKSRLFHLYGPNKPSPQKLRVMELFKRRMPFEAIAQSAGVKPATAKVYAIDCLGAGMDLDHEVLADMLQVSASVFSNIKAEVEKCSKLRDIKEAVPVPVTYNQIRFVIACMIRELLI